MEAINFLQNKKEIVKDFNLDNIKRILPYLENPQDKLKCIHVAGTNGKGSVCAMINQGLIDAGFKIGLYTSPHLNNINERIKINNTDISDSELNNILQKIKQKSESNNIVLTYFEYLTLAAFIYFKKNNIDFAVLETGMGGRLDATSIINPVLAIITSISMDHEYFLGYTLDKIASEKVAIVKPNSTVITIKENMEIESFNKACIEKNSKVIIPEIEDMENIEISLKGDFQKQNASLAVAALKSLGINTNTINYALKNTKWPGRFEMIKPNILLDSAHNPGGIRALTYSVKKLKYNSLILVFGVMKDKDIGSIAEVLGPLTDKVVLTRPNQDRSADPNDLSRFFQSPTIMPSVKEAVEYAQNIASEQDLILITGSIFTVAEARHLFFP
ncbi:MAG: folylpolyglutamate synthase/dihydrofolate synthase family protein [Candidatus Woesearchaeota archaeon]